MLSDKMFHEDEAHYAFKIAYYVFEQCSKNLPIMLQLYSELSHYTLNMQVQFYN